MSSWNKERLSTSLAGTITQCEDMPQHQVTSLYTVTMQQEDLTVIPVLKLH